MDFIQLMLFVILVIPHVEVAQEDLRNAQVALKEHICKVNLAIKNVMLVTFKMKISIFVKNVFLPVVLVRQI